MISSSEKNTFHFPFSKGKEKQGTYQTGNATQDLAVEERFGQFGASEFQADQFGN